MLKLIHVGNSFIDISSKLYVIPCYFQPWSEEENCPKSNSILTYVASSSIAGQLICGSLWTDFDTPYISGVTTSPDSQIFWAGADLKSAVLLKDLVNPSALTPSTFWLDKGNTWVICIALKNKKVIVPYFELLRILFYNASRRLTKFFFSFLPLSLLCRLLRHPTKENNLTTEFCVAGTELYQEEAILISNLLSNATLRRFFHLSQANQIDVSQNNKLGPTSTVEIKTVGNIGKNILFKSNGYNFTHDNELYFWVESLEIIKIHYCFQRIIFYPIVETDIHLPTSDNLLICSNLFQHIHKLNPKRHKYNKQPEKILSTDLKSARKRASYRRYSDIIIIRGAPWAKSPSDKNTFNWFNDTLINNVLATYSKYKAKNRIYSQTLHNILLTFKTAGYSVTYLSLNNPKNVFCRNISTFPINGQPPLLGSIHKNLIHCFIIAEIQLSNTVFFLAQPFPNSHPNFIILCQKLNLSSPDELEWNELFSRVSPVYDYRTFHKFSKDINLLYKANSSYNLGLITVPIPAKEITVAYCLEFTDHIVNAFRRRIQFQVASSLKFPKGLTQERYQKIVKIGACICKAPNRKWINRISSYWS